MQSTRPRRMRAHADIQIVRASCSGTRVLVTESANVEAMELDILGGCERAWEAWQSHEALRIAQEVFSTNADRIVAGVDHAHAPDKTRYVQKFLDGAASAPPSEWFLTGETTNGEPIKPFLSMKVKK